MKNSIITIASTVALIFSFASCKEDNSVLIQKIESSQLKLLKQDSVLTNQRNELSNLVFTDTSASSGIITPEDSLLTVLVTEQNTLITRIEIIIQKNKELITQLNDDSVNPIEAEKEYTAHVDELELMKTQISATNESYETLINQMKDISKRVSDTTKVK